VYLVQAGTDGPVKIGWARVVARRLGELQGASPVELELRRALDGPPELEAALHGAFAALRLHGEWFEPAVLDGLDQALADIELPSAKMPSTQVWRQPARPRVHGCPHLGAAVRSLRTDAAQTVAELANAAGLKARVVNRVERAQQVVT
jgi:hypothetical protein